MTPAFGMLLVIALLTGFILLIMYIRFKKKEEETKVTTDITNPVVVVNNAPAIHVEHGNLDYTIKGTMAELDTKAQEYYKNVMEGNHIGKWGLETGLYSLTVFMKELNNRFNKVNIIFKQELSESKGILHLECINFVGDKTYKAFAGVWWGIRPIERFQSKKGWDLEKRVKETELKVIEASVIIYPDPKLKTNIKIENFKASLEEAEVVRKPEERAPSTFYKLTKSKWGGMQLNSMAIPQDWPLRAEELETNYPRIYMSYQAEFGMYSIDKVRFMALNSLVHGKSVGINGIYGPGKSRLLFDIAYEIGSSEKFRVILADAKVISMMFEEGEDVGHLFAGDGVQNVLVIDEIDDIMDKNPSLFKDLTDGIKKRLYHLCLLYTFNAQLEEGNHMLRPGRSLLVEPKKMSVAEAVIIAKRLNKTEETELTGLRFDMNGFSAWIEKFKGNTSPEIITLAEIYDFCEEEEEYRQEEEYSKLVAEHMTPKVNEQVTPAVQPSTPIVPVIVPEVTTGPKKQIQLKSRTKK